jgi:enoyl-[acyl-carrier protein] reductase I
LLEGKRGLVIALPTTVDRVGLRGISRARCRAGRDLSERRLRFVDPLAEALEAPIVMPLDVRTPGRWKQSSSAFQGVGRLDFAVHSIAFSPRTRFRAGSWMSRMTDF